MKTTTCVMASLLLTTAVWLVMPCNVHGAYISPCKPAGPYNSPGMADIVKPGHPVVDIKDVPYKILQYKWGGEWNPWAPLPLIVYGMFFPLWPMEGIWFEEGMQEIVADTRWGYTFYDPIEGGYPDIITWVNNTVNDDNLYYEWWSTPAATPSHVGGALGNWSQGFVFDVPSPADHVTNRPRVKSSSPGIVFSLIIPVLEIPITVSLAPGEDMAYGERELLVWRTGVTNTIPCLY